MKKGYNEPFFLILIIENLNYFIESISIFYVSHD